MASWLAARFSVFDVFAFAALGHLGVTLIFGLMLTRQDARLEPPRRPEKGRAFWRVLPGTKVVGILGVLCFRTALLLHLTLLPLAMLNDFHGTYTNVGLTASLAAALEVPFMLGWGILSAKWSKERILILNGVLFAVYLAAMMFARTPEHVLWLQVPKAIATSALLSLTISYVQDSIKGQVGLSTSLTDVITVVATMATALAFRTFSDEQSFVAGLASPQVPHFWGA